MAIDWPYVEAVVENLVRSGASSFAMAVVQP